MNEYVLGVDLGTSAVKVSAMNRDAKLSPSKVMITHCLSRTLATVNKTPKNGFLGQLLLSCN